MRAVGRMPWYIELLGVQNPHYNAYNNCFLIVDIQDRIDGILTCLAPSTPVSKPARLCCAREVLRRARVETLGHLAVFHALSEMYHRRHLEDTEKSVRSTSRSEDVWMPSSVACSRRQLLRRTSAMSTKPSETPHLSDSNQTIISQLQPPLLPRHFLPFRVRRSLQLAVRRSTD
ncbi:hypothetical protein FIBSPDRAFT_433231 [Athelia psychrophila]|uniref:Uncharacterized protein n=1 Tax=Athelia psychrophila TaxID=1759441 RepID=A0A167UHN8_9AGAM|nr:hypothetical protein FIBSPDRAFT_433231 [Fibularhizoctonia sp. CBS 109695]